MRPVCVQTLFDGQRSKAAKSEQAKPMVFTGRDGSYRPYGRGLKVHSMLVTKVDHVGDFALALDAFHLLRRTFHEAKITLLCGPWNATLARSSGLFDEIVTATFFPSRADAPLITFTPDIIGDLRGRSFDLAIDLRVDPDTRIILNHVDASFTCGYDSHLLTRPLTVSLSPPRLSLAPDLGMHQSLMLLRLAHTVTQFFRPSEPIRALMTNVLANDPEIDLAFAFGRRLVTLNTSSGRAAKNWPLDRFKRLARWLCRDLETCVLLIGTKDQEAEAQEIISFCGSDRIQSAIGRTTLPQALGLISRSCLFIGNDSGLTHFAARMDVPTVAIYSGIDPTEIWAPRGARLTVIKSPVSCSPCHILKLSDCRNDHACIRSISFSYVRSVVRDVLMQLFFEPLAADPEGRDRHLRSAA